MDLNQIAAFTRVVETGSFRRAAQQLRVPASTVSRRIARLEKTLGARLLQRTTRQVSLTDAGKIYFDKVSPALTAVQDAAGYVSDEHSVARGRIRVTAPVDVGNSFFVEIVGRFVREHPEIQLDIELTARAVNLVEEGFDLAIRAGTLRDSTLIARKLFTIERGLFASSAYLSRRDRPRRPVDLIEHDCILFRPRTDTERWVLTNGKRDEVVDVSGPVVCEEYLFAKNAVVEGCGVALLPSFLLVRELAEGRARRVLPSWSGPGATLHVVYPSARYLPRRVALFRDFVVKSLSPPPWDEAG